MNLKIKKRTNNRKKCEGDFLISEIENKGRLLVDPVKNFFINPEFTSVIDGTSSMSCFQTVYSPTSWVLEKELETNFFTFKTIIYTIDPNIKKSTLYF